MIFDETMVRITIEHAINQAIADAVADIVAREMRVALRAREDVITKLVQSAITAAFREEP
jgi:hypothetical protein